MPAFTPPSSTGDTAGSVSAGKSLSIVYPVLVNVVSLLFRRENALSVVCFVFFRNHNVAFKKLVELGYFMQWCKRSLLHRVSGLCLPSIGGKTQL